MRASRAENVALFESVEPGAGAALERYLDSAASTYDIARRRFLYTNFDDLRAFAAPEVLGGARAPRATARHAARPLRGALRARSAAAAGARLPGGVPRLVAVGHPGMYHLMSHLDLEQGVLYPRGGFGALIARIAAIAEAAGVDVITTAPGRGDRPDRRRDPVGHRRALPRRARRGPSRGRAPRRLGGRPPPHRDRAAAAPGPDLSRVVVGAAHLGARSRARHARGPRRGAGARAPHAVLHRGLVDELRGHLRRRPADPRPRVVLRLHAERERPDRRSPGRHEPVRAGPGARRRLDRARRRRRRRRPARRGGRRPGDRADRGGIRIDRPRAARRGAPDRRARPTSPRTCTRGRAAPSASRTPCGRARSCAAPTDRAACTDCSTRAGRACRASACRCA